MNYASAVAHASSGPSAESAGLTQLHRPAAIDVEADREYANIWLTGSMNRADIERIGGTVHTIAGNVMTVHLPLDAVGKLSQISGLRNVLLAQPMQFQSDVVMHETGVDMLWGGMPPYYSSSGVTGTGVIVGIVDTGIDPTHPDFSTPSGTRIKFLWDQVFYGTPPAGFTYGTEYSAANINAGQCTSFDIEGHGTHVAGVAAGNGSATGNGQPAYTYIGAAPEADIVAVKLKTLADGSVTDDKVLDGVRYVFERADALGKPAVVLLAVSKSVGPHDGRDPLDLAITAMTGPGHLVCVAAGNWGGKARHAEWRASHINDSGDITVDVPTYYPSINAADHFTSEGWHRPTAAFDISVITPTGEVIGPVAHGADTLAYTESGVVQIQNGIYTDVNGAFRVTMHVYRSGSSLPPVASGTWTYRFTETSPGTHRVDLWFKDYALGSAVPTFVQGMTEAYLVGSPATADNVIAVGSYSTKRYWTAVDGRTYFIPSATVGDLDETSSPGPRRDGVLVPHIAAPGLSVASTRSMQSYPSTMFLMPDSVHTIRYGTSVAAASVAGTIALLMQHNPTATPKQALQMIQDAASDGYTGTVPNTSWGYGKLRAPTTTLGVIEDGNPGVGFSIASGNPARGSVSFQFALSSADLAGDVHIDIVDVTGRRVATMAPALQTGTQRVLWNGHTGASRAPAGVYWAQLKTIAGTSTKTFVLLK